MAKTWAEIDAMRARAGMSKSELCRSAGISESALHIGIRKNSGLKLATEKVLLAAIEEHLQQEQERRNLDAAE